MVFITRLTLLANRHAHALHISTQEDAWVAQPLFRLVRSYIHLNFLPHWNNFRVSHLRPMDMTAGYGFYAPLQPFSGDSIILH
jgi:hypothetical protein